MKLNLKILNWMKNKNNIKNPNKHTLYILLQDLFNLKN